MYSILVLGCIDVDIYLLNVFSFSASSVPNVRLRRLPMGAFLDRVLVLVTGLVHFLNIERYLQARLDLTPVPGSLRRRGRPRRDSVPYPVVPSQDFLRIQIAETRELAQQRMQELYAVVCTHVTPIMPPDLSGCAHIGQGSSICLGYL